MTGVARGSAVLVLLATLGTGLVGPCLCGPWGAEARGAHDCCEPEVGLKAASAGCCAPALRAPDAALAGSGHAWAVPSVVPHPVRLAPAILVVVPAVTNSPFATSPPPVLRI
jgi:hypothetical protein